MGLFSVLDDIQGDVKDISVATEVITAKDDATQAFEIYAKPLDKQVLDKFNTLCWLTSTKRTIAPMPKVSLGIAQEVFTMLPDASQTNLAKMTAQASAGNKLRLEEIIDAEDLTVPTEIIEAINNILTIYALNKEYIDGVLIGLEHICTTINDNLIRFKDSPPILLYGHVAINLLTTDIVELHHSNGLYSSYDKYAGVLDVKFSKLYESLRNSEILAEVIPCTGEQHIDTSLDSLTRDINNLYCSAIAKVDSLKDFIGVITNITDTAIINDSSLAERLNDSLASMLLLKAVYTVLNTPDNFIAGTASILEFLD